MNDEQASETKRAALSSTLSGLLDEAIKGRASSGVEQIWREDDEYYEGMDDSNREDRLLKPTSSDGRVSVKQKPKKNTRSTVFVNITSQYVNAAAAHVSDKLFPNDDSNYGIRPTPIPDLIGKSKSADQAINEMGQPITLPVMDENGNPKEQPHMVNGEPMIDNATGQPVVVPETKTATVGDLAKEEMRKAKEAAKKAKTQIDDWLTECGSNGHNRQVVHDAARIGTGVLKGPFPELTRQRAVLNSPDGVKMVMNEKVVPKSRRINVWNLYPDPSCGEDIHRGKYIFEDDEINSRLLSELKKDPSYIASAIDRVIEEGPKSQVTGTTKRNKNWNKGDTELFQIWYFHGYLSAQDLMDCGYEFEDEEPKEQGLLDAEQHDSTELPSDYLSENPDSDEPTEGEYIAAGEDPETKEPEERNEQYPVIVVMINGTIIKATLSPFDSGRFPYQIMRWQYRAGHWTGVGVGRQMRTSQDGVNAGTRMLHDNAGVSGAPILIIDRKRIIPADGRWEVGPHKIYYTTEDYDGGNIRDAITWVLTPSMQAEMMNIIQFWMNMAEKETGLPALLQGQQSDRQATLGEIQTRNNNGNSMLRRVTNIYDDDVTKHHIGGYYEWLLLYGEDDSMKGDFTIDARGSSVLIERDQHSQLLMQMLGISLNPAYGADPELVYKEVLMSQRFDAEKLLLSEEKKAEMAKRQPPPDPRIQVAQIKSEDTKNELQARLAFEAQENQVEAALRQWEKNVELAIENAKVQAGREISADEQKVILARESMKLRTQVALAMRANQSAPQVANAAMEPQGRAPNGQGFQK